LVTAPIHAGSEETVEVSHEALIRNWGRLRAWINKDREFLLWHERLRGLLAEWQRSQEDASILLRGSLLTEAEHWLKERGDQLSPEERGYIDHSSVLQEREQQAEKERHERELQQAQVLAAAEAKRAEEQAKSSRTLKQFSVVLVIAAIVLAVSTWVALEQRNKAQDLSKIALSRQLVAQSLADAYSSNLDQTLFRSLVARRVAQTIETQGGLLRALQHVPRRLSFLWGHNTRVNSVAFSPDGKTLASGSDDGTVILWDMASRKPLGGPLAGHKDEVWSVAFNPDGKTLV
jgi:type II secretory pathway pseudopilin PulG